MGTPSSLCTPGEAGLKTANRDPPPANACSGQWKRQSEFTVVSGVRTRNLSWPHFTKPLSTVVTCFTLSLILGPEWIWPDPGSSHPLIFPKICPPRSLSTWPAGLHPSGPENHQQAFQFSSVQSLSRVLYITLNQEVRTSREGWGPAVVSFPHCLGNYNSIQGWQSLYVAFCPTYILDFPGELWKHWWCPNFASESLKWLVKHLCQAVGCLINVTWLRTLTRPWISASKVPEQ